jgi:hypothetical protein
MKEWEGFKYPHHQPRSPPRRRSLGASNCSGLRAAAHTHGVTVGFLPPARFHFENSCTAVSCCWRQLLDRCALFGNACAQKALGSVFRLGYRFPDPNVARKGMRRHCDLYCDWSRLSCTKPSRPISGSGRCSMLRPGTSQTRSETGRSGLSTMHNRCHACKRWKRRPRNRRWTQSTGMENRTMGKSKSGQKTNCAAALSSDGGLFPDGDENTGSKSSSLRSDTT